MLADPRSVELEHCTPKFQAVLAGLSVFFKTFLSRREDFIAGGAQLRGRIIEGRKIKLRKASHRAGKIEFFHCTLLNAFTTSLTFSRTITALAPY